MISKGLDHNRTSSDFCVFPHQWWYCLRG